MLYTYCFLVGTDCHISILDLRLPVMLSHLIRDGLIVMHKSSLWTPNHKVEIMLPYIGMHIPLAVMF